MSDGPGMMHGVCDWLHHNEPSAAQTNASVRLVQGRRKLKAAMEAYPHLRPRAEELVRGGITNPSVILYRLGLAGQQFTFLKSRPAN